MLQREGRSLIFSPAITLQPVASFFVLSLAEFCYKQSALQKIALLINWL